MSRDLVAIVSSGNQLSKGERSEKYKVSKNAPHRCANTDATLTTVAY